MKITCKHLMYFFLLVHCISSTYGQDVGFSQFYEQPLLRNPALAGIFTGDIRATASYRNQWQSVTVPYRTFALSTDIKFPLNLADYDITLTVGLELMRDVAGTSQFNTTHVLPALNASIRVGENSFFSGAFMGGLRQQRFDPSKLIFNDQFRAGSNGSFSVVPYTNQVFNNTSVNYFDLSTGISYNSAFGENTDYYIGLGLFHARSPNVGFFEGNKIVLNKKIAFNIGLSSSISDQDEVILYGDYFDQRGEHFNNVSSTFQSGLLIKHNILDDEDKTITAGVIYRLDDAIIPTLQLQLSKFTIGTSYDININKLAVASQYRGGFELTLSYKDFFNSRRADLIGITCPRFGNHKKLY